jgi:pimeloyl-ACP methyl ester carboxylesterase
MSKVAQYSKGSPSLRYDDYGGEGPTLLLLHGVTRCGEDWGRLIAQWTADWRVIALDQRGHGDSERAERYLVTDYVADIVRFVRDELSMPITIFGHSLGSMVAAAVAAEAPHRIQGIILEDPPFHTMGTRIEGSVWQAQFIGMRQVVKQGGSIEAITNALSDIRLPIDGGLRRLGELRDRASLTWSAKCLSRLDANVLTPVIEGRWLDGYDVLKTLSSVRCPTLLLQGDPTVGGALTDTDAAEAVSALSDCKHVRFSGVGHQLHRDRPSEVLQALQDFVASSHCTDHLSRIG